ncbi:MAG: response regulator [Bacteroidetes bacterium]|nr:response regulator [Bacteroidota bacterium]
MSTKKNFLVFLVDDEIMLLNGLKHHLSATLADNSEIKTFATGEECIANLKLKPDVIFLDYYLDGADPEAENGLETLKKIKDSDPETRVIMLSGQQGFGAAAQTLLKGAEDYIIKGDQAFTRVEEMIKEFMQKEQA